MASITQEQFWTDFFELYRSFPEVWQVKNEKYKMKHLRQKAYEALLNKYKEIEPNASIDGMKKKLNNIRTSYRRELKKMLRSEKSGCGTDEIYIPNLWYFDKLSFLEEQEVQSNTVSSEDILNETEEVDITYSAPKKRVREDFLNKALKHLENSKPQDDATILSTSWAALYRKLDVKQQIFANKSINDILYQGALGNLSENTTNLLDFSQKQKNIEINSPSSFGDSEAYNSTPKQRKTFKYISPHHQKTQQHFHPYTQKKQMLYRSQPYRVVYEDDDEEEENQELLNSSQQQSFESQSQHVSKQKYRSFKELFNDVEYI